MRATTLAVWQQFAAALVFAAFVVLLSKPWHPPVGVYIGVLAFLGVIVPLVRGDKIKPREKAIWTGLMLLLVMLEINSIYKDRAEHDKQEAEARKLQLDNFRAIGDGIDKQIANSDSEFAATMSQFYLTANGINGVQLSLGDVKTELHTMHVSQTSEMAESKAVSSNFPPIKTGTAIAAAQTGPTIPDTLGLRTQALQLARDMTDWLIGISGDAPATKSPPSFPPSPEEAAKIGEFTMRLQSEWFSKGFSAGAPQMLSRLLAVGALTGLYHNCDGNVGRFGLDLLNARKYCAQIIEQGALNLK